ncbi:hypothetical protein QOZ80_3AG0243560 [Eleusine coracana subsp. coracana]|nr:hypothetical protein QOZ80_3AG0243560 [Eleusine coracana subsp. coracana]
MEWVLKHHDLDLYPYVSRAVVHSEYHEVTDGPWILLENDHDNDNDTTDNDKVLRNGDYDWDSDEDNILDEDGDEEQLTDSKRIYFLGFHPYKEIIFLMTSSIGIAYHLNTSKVQYLGRLIPNNYYSLYRHAAVYESFLYTPFMSGDPSNTNNENHPDNQQYI